MLLTEEVFPVSNLVRAGEDQYNSAYWNSGSKTVVPTMKAAWAVIILSDILLLVES